MPHLLKIFATLFICLPISAMAGEKKDIVQHAHELAVRVQSVLEKNLLSEAQIYTYLTEMVTFDEKVYGSALAFNPSFLDGHALFLKHNVSKHGAILYSPYVCRDKELFLKAIDIGNISRDYGYDYTTWEWYSTPMTEQKAHWTEPYFDDGAGGIEMITYSIPVGKIAILTFDLPYEK